MKNLINEIKENKVKRKNFYNSNEFHQIFDDIFRHFIDTKSKFLMINDETHIKCLDSIIEYNKDRLYYTPYKKYTYLYKNIFIEKSVNDNSWLYIIYKYPLII